MGALGGEYVGPPVPSGDEQKNRKKNRVRGKKERDFAVGEARGPGDLRRDIILNGAGEDTAQRAEKCLRVRWFGLDPRPEFGIHRLFRPSIDYLSRAAFLVAGLSAAKERSVSDNEGRIAKFWVSIMTVYGLQFRARRGVPSIEKVLADMPPRRPAEQLRD